MTIEEYLIENLQMVGNIWRKSKELIFQNKLENAALLLEDSIVKYSLEAVSLRFELAQIYHYQAESGIDDFEKIISILLSAIEHAAKMQEYVAFKKPKRFISAQAKKQAVKWDMMCEEISFSDRSVEKLGLIYCQLGRDLEASQLLSQAGFTHRLSNCVLNYNKSLSTSSPHQDQDQDQQGQEMNEFASYFDNVLDSDAKSILAKFLSPGSQFWKLHNYNEFESTGYFSYLFSLQDEPSNFIEQLISRIFKLIQHHDPQKASQIKVAEWWVHCRPHSNGHQMHYDSENEGTGVVRHPLLSSVLYVEGEVGGPTFVTNQLLKGNTLAEKGWFIFPKENRLAVFDAKYLHGVIPGSGCPKDARSRRITFMIGFWDHIQPIDQPGHGASRILPKNADWIEGIPLHDGPILNPTTNIDPSPPVPVPVVWQSIDCKDLDDLTLPPYECCFQGF